MRWGAFKGCLPSEHWFMEAWLKRKWGEVSFCLARSCKPVIVALMRENLACVGLIVLVGCFTLVISPDDLLRPPAPESEPGMPTIVIDPGHGGMDEGARSKGVVEKELTLEMAFRVEKELQKRGFATLMTRTEDRYVSLADRVAVANELEVPSVFISIHFNQGNTSRMNGVETFYALFKAPLSADWTWVGLFDTVQQQDFSDETLAAEVQGAVVAKTGARNRGALPRDLYVTRKTRVPAILIEGGFITSTKEKERLASDEYAEQLAQGIAEGVEKWYLARPKPNLAPLAEMQ